MFPLDVLREPVWQPLTWTLLHFLWQGLAVAAVVATLLYVWPVRRAGHRYLFYLAALVTMAACPLVTFMVIEVPESTAVASREVETEASLPPPAEPGPELVASEIRIVPTGPAARESQPPLERSETAPLQGVAPADPDLEDSASLPVPATREARLPRYADAIQPYCLMIWMAGVLLLAVRLSLSWLHVRWLAWCRRVIPADLAAKAATLGERLGLRFPPRVCVSEKIREAIVVGLWRPLVLLPTSWLTEMTPEVLEAVIAHELAHVRRLDLWVNLLQRFMETLLFYHPAVWWLSRRVSLEREMCTDELAVGATRERLVYVTALEQLGRMRLGQTTPQLGAGIGGNKMVLLSRVSNILGSSASNRRARWWPVGLLALAVPLVIWLASTSIVWPTENETRAGEVADNIADTATSEKVVDETENEAFRGKPVADDDRIAQLIEQLGDDTYGRREAAQRELIQIGAPARTALQAALGHADIEVASRAKRCLAEIYLKSLIAALGDDDDRAWTAAVKALATLGKPVVEELVAALEDKDPRVRRGAVQALGRIKTARVIDPLIKMLNDPEATIRTDAAVGLGNFGSHSTQDLMVPALAAAVKDKDRQVRAAAASALGYANDARAVQPLLGALGDEHPAVRWCAAEGLGYLRAKAAVEPLTAALRSDNKTLRRKAAAALGRIGDRRPLPRLSALAANDEHADVRAAAGEALRIIEHPQPRPSPIAWGKPVDGLQAGLRCTSGMAPYRYGQIVRYELLVRNLGQRDRMVQGTPFLAGWFPWVKDGQVLLRGMMIGGPDLELTRKIPVGRTEPIDWIACTVRPSDWKKHDSPPSLRVAPGQYEASTTFVSSRRDPKLKDVWQGKLCTGELPLEVMRPGFSPVIERVLRSGPEAASAFIDFDSGKLIAPPGELDLSDVEKVDRWAKQSGVDARLAIAERGRGLRFFETFAGYMTGDSAKAEWNSITADSLRGGIAGARWGTVRLGVEGFPSREDRSREGLNQTYTVEADDLPMSITFQTREGGIGILQILGFTDKPKGVKIRYKLVRADGEKNWGEPVEGVQVRLRADKKTWKTGTLPSFKADVRNQGKRDISVLPAQHGFEVEVDGRWCFRYAPGYDVPNKKVRPGARCEDIVISLGHEWLDKEVWNSKRGPERVKRVALLPGRHVVRVAPGLADSDVRAVSNPVEIEIVAKNDEKVGPTQENNADVTTAKPTVEATAAKRDDQTTPVSPVSTPTLDGKEILEKLKSFDAVYAAAFTASGNRPGWPKKKWKLTMLDGEIVYEEQVVEIPEPAEDRMGRWIPFRRTFYVGPRVQAEHDWVGRIRRYGPLDPWPENNPGPATAGVLGVVKPDAPTYMFLIKRPLLCLGRGYSKYLTDIKEVIKQEDGRLKMTADGIDIAYRPGAKWELVIATDAAYMVRSAKMVDNRKRSMSILNSGLKWYGARCVPEEAECKGKYMDASFEIQSASSEGDTEFLKHAKDTMRPPYLIHTDIKDKRVSPGLFVSYDAGELSPKGGKPDWDLDLENPKQPATQWGEPVDGVQVRLRAAKRMGNEGETVTLLTEARNNGKRRLHLPKDGRRCQVEVDEKWYEWVDPRLLKESRDEDELNVSMSSELLAFERGKTHTNLTVSIPANWRRIPDGKEVEYGARSFSHGISAGLYQTPLPSLLLAPGKHRIRVAYICSPARAAAPYTNVRAISNPVEIEIAADDDDQVDISVNVADSPKVTVDLINAVGIQQRPSFWIGRERLTREALLDRLGELRDKSPTLQVAIRHTASTEEKELTALRQSLVKLNIRDVSIGRHDLPHVFAYANAKFHGTIRGRVVDAHPTVPSPKYHVMLWKKGMETQSGENPSLVVGAGEAFEFRHVGPGDYELRTREWRPSGRVVHSGADWTYVQTKAAVEDGKVTEVQVVFGKGDTGRWSDAYTWGEAVEGLIIHVTRAKFTIAPGEKIELHVDVYNGGKIDRKIVLNHENWELEIDGQWLKESGGASSGRAVYLLEPKRAQHDIDVWVWLGKNMTSAIKGLPPGKHTLRVAHLLNGEGRSSNDPPQRRVVSQPVMIEVVAEDEGEGIGAEDSTGVEPEDGSAVPPSKTTVRGEVLGADGKPVRAASNPIEIEIVAKGDEKAGATPKGNADLTTAESTVEAATTKRVIDAQGKPVPGAKVGFYENRTPRGESPFSSTVTNQAGEFPCPDRAPDKVRFSFYLVVSAPGFRTGEWLGHYLVDGRRIGARLPDTLRLDREVTISGMVLGADGKPLAGVPLAVDYFNQRGTWANPRRIQSDEQGRFKIDDLPPADIFIRYEKGQDDTSRGAGDAQLFISHVRAKDGEQVGNVVVDLSKAKCVVEGQLVDHEGNGIEGASVKANFAASASRLAHYAWARTDRNGRYRIEGLPPHEFLVSAWAKNHFGGPGERVKLEIAETKTLRLLGYLPGNPAPEPKPDDPRWGKPAGDLRAAVELRPGRKSYELGEIVEVRPILRNTGEKTVTLIHDFARAVELQVTDEAGMAQTFSYKGFSGITVSTTYVLEPGHEVEMQGQFRLKLLGADYTDDLIQTPGTLLAFPLKCRPGAKYELSYDLGEGLRTGEADLVVKD